MLFARTSRFRTSAPVEDLKSRLVGQHVKIHNMDFEITERDHVIKIIPHAENTESVKTLPITHVELDGSGKETRVKVRSKMRRIDAGGPLLIVLFCIFMVIAALVLLIADAPEMRKPSFILMGAAVAIFIIFWIRMESGYFDYVRKIRDFVRNLAAA